MPQKEALTERLKYLTEVFRVAGFSCLPEEVGQLYFGLGRAISGDPSLRWLE